MSGLVDYNSKYRFKLSILYKKQRENSEWTGYKNNKKINNALYRVYQNDCSGLEVDYLYKYGEESYKY
jgi:hypothetical protein